MLRKPSINKLSTVALVILAINTILYYLVIYFHPTPGDYNSYLMLPGYIIGSIFAILLLYAIIAIAISVFKKISSKIVTMLH